MRKKARTRERGTATDRLNNRHIHRQTHRQVDGDTERQANRQRERERERDNERGGEEKIPLTVYSHRRRIHRTTMRNLLQVP